MPRPRKPLVTNDLPELMDTREVAEYLHTTPAAVRVMVSRGQLPKPFMRTRSNLWRAADLAAWLLNKKK